MGSPSRGVIDDLLGRIEADGVEFLQLQLTDIMGVNKTVEVPRSEFRKALEGQIMFDGSSVEGFVRIEESDMLLRPDLETYTAYPWQEPQGRVGRLICDIYRPDGSPFEGCPRLALKRICEKAEQLGYTMQAGPEPEFFLFHRGEQGQPTTRSHDAGGYFDLRPLDRGDDARRAITKALEAVGFEVEAAHHEVAPAQHEIDFKHAPALRTADNIATFRFVVRKVALDFGLHATFMPKPVFGVNGSGMHIHQSLFEGERNAFYDASDERGLSRLAGSYIAGVLRHARELCAVTNPLVNSYKRLVPGYEAPTHIAWSEKNRSPLIRVPDRRGEGTRIELRMPDPACNPYLALGVSLAAGLDGIEQGWDPGPPVNKNIFAMSHRERRRLKIDSLPGDLGEAVDVMAKSAFMRETLGDHIFTHYVQAKRTEWSQYIAQVHEWELDHYLSRY